MNDAPLICDPVPRRGVLIMPGPISLAQLERFKVAWKRAYSGIGNSSKVLIMDAEWTALDDELQWPDAEFCAA